MAKRDLPPLSEAQLEIVNIIWDHGEVTVSQVREILARRRPIARNTVSTMITRLQEKGWLRRRISRGTHRYSVVPPRKKVLTRMVDRLVDAAFQGSTEKLVLSILDEGRLSADEVRRIKAMLDKAERVLREEE